MTAGWLGHRTVALPTCTSTSDVALTLAREGAAHGTVVVADAQTAGRGRLGRVWASPPGLHLYMSAIVRLEAARPPPERAALTLAVGVGVVDAVHGAGAPHAGLKWPNDVLVRGRKLAGVLCEATGDAIVVGVGVNLADDPAGLPDDVAARATSLEAEVGAPVGRDAFLDRLLRAVEPWLDRFAAHGPAAIVGPWQDRMVPGLRLTWDAHGGPIAGRAAGLEPDGALRLIDDAGVVHRVLAGEVALAP